MIQIIEQSRSMIIVKAILFGERAKAMWGRYPETLGIVRLWTTPASDWGISKQYYELNLTLDINWASLRHHRILLLSIQVALWTLNPTSNSLEKTIRRSEGGSGTELLASGISPRTSTMYSRSYLDRLSSGRIHSPPQPHIPLQGSRGRSIGESQQDRG